MESETFPEWETAGSRIPAISFSTYSSPSNSARKLALPEISTPFGPSEKFSMIVIRVLVYLLLCLVGHAKSRTIIRTPPIHNGQLKIGSSAEQLFRRAPPPPPVRYTPPNRRSSTPSYGRTQQQLWDGSTRLPSQYRGSESPATGNPANSVEGLAHRDAVQHGYAQNPTQRGRSQRGRTQRPIQHGARNYETPTGYTKPHTGKPRIANNGESLPLSRSESDRSAPKLRYVPGQPWVRKRPPTPTMVKQQRVKDLRITPPPEFLPQESLPEGPTIPSPNSKLDPTNAPPGRGWMWPGRKNPWGPPARKWDPGLMENRGRGHTQPSGQLSSEEQSGRPWPKPPPGRGWPLGIPPKTMAEGTRWDPSSPSYGNAAGAIGRRDLPSRGTLSV